MVARGRFVSLEGIDGSGKTTQAALLSDALRAEGRDVVTAREPGGTALGEALREVLLARRPDELAPLAEAHLFAAARAQLAAEVIRPALEAGRWVVVDRYVDSSLAYQGAGRELGIETVLDINAAVVESTMPDLTIWVDVPVELAGARRCADADRIEAEGADFQRRVAAGYRQVSLDDPQRVQRVDGGGGVEAVHAAILACAERLG